MPRFIRDQDKMEMARPLNGHRLPHTISESRFEIRSNEVQDIMTRMPHLLIRQGMSLMVAVILLLLLAANFIQFPELVSCPVVVNSSSSAYGELPLEKAYKVAPGQRVLIKLSQYPSEEFGMVEGIVDSVNDASIKIKLGRGLVTDSQKKIPFYQGLAGSADIVTADKSVLERVAESLVGRRK